MKKYLCIYAHFYQPPRENPWLGEIEKQDSAFPYDNWNHKIAMECYFPNLFGRIKNFKGDTLEIVNNYEYLNFNFGPTILQWWEKSYPQYYQYFITTMKKIKDKKGYANVIAQAYNHTILPLDNFQDRLTQIIWGIKDFEYRFGFLPSGMWLPETAINEDTLRILIDKGIKYVILVPYQIKNPKSLKTGEKLNPIDFTKSYLWFDRDEKNNKLKNRYINIFIYHGELTRKTAFDNILINSSTFCENISLCYNSTDGPQLIIIATDGETYGHHHKFADMTLSHLFRHELKKRDIEIINLEEYLAKYPSEYEVEIEDGIDGDGTSWSCSHGLRRWKGGCPCGDEGKYNTSWRLPVRNAIEWLREVFLDILKEEGKNIFPDVWKARNEYINYLNNKTEESWKTFLKENTYPNITEEQKEKTIKLLEMQRYSMLMFTSCGWFFNDISRIEMQQNLKYASRAMELAESFGFKGIERIFTSILQMAESNFKEIGNGRNVYEKFIKISKITEEQIACYFTYKIFFYQKEYYSNSRYEIKLIEKKVLNNYINLKIQLNDNELMKNAFYSIIIHLKLNSLPEFKIAKIAENTDISIIEKNAYKEMHINLFPSSIQRAIIDMALHKIKKENMAKAEELVNIYLELIEENPSILIENFANINEEIKFYSTQIIVDYLKELIILRKKENLKEIKLFIERLSQSQIKISLNDKGSLLELMPVFTELLFSNFFTEDEANTLCKIFSYTKLDEFVFHIENYKWNYLPKLTNF